MTEWMVDIETFDTKPTAVVTAICLYKMSGIRSFNFYPKLQPQIDKGRTVSADTLFFWFNQSKEAVELGTGPNYEKGRGDVTYDLKTMATAIGKDDIVWANGPSFDLVILESLFRDFGVETPWSYRNTRDLRTLKSLVKVPSGWKPDNADRLVAHDPLSDCIWQTKLVEYIRKQLDN